MQDPGTPPTGLDEPTKTSAELPEFDAPPNAFDGPGQDFEQPTCAESVEIDLDRTPRPGAEESAPARRSGRIRTILLTGLLIAVVAGLVVAVVAGWGIWSEKDATLVAPAQVAGLRLDDSADGTANADYLRTALAADIDLDHTVGAVYADSGSRPVLFFGGTALIWSPDKDLDAAFGLISDGQGAVTGLHDVPAGHLGGTMRCGTTKTDDGDMPVCGWADHGCLALAMFPQRAEADAVALMPEIRGATQTRR